jgi:hypothetical protein
MNRLLPLGRKTLLLSFSALLVSLALINPARPAHAQIVNCPPEDYRDHCTLYYTDATRSQLACSDCCGNFDCQPTPYYYSVVACCI